MGSSPQFSLFCGYWGFSHFTQQLDSFTSSWLWAEAKRYEGRLQKGGILLSVHCDTSDEIKRAKELQKATNAEDVSSTGEASVHQKEMDRETVRVGR